ncbi:hypothetical protein [Schlesneria paludicola]|uniref:hypothetical protein n=1 Tax=Schlesneria paludicola TaxID=360056 RepID=UPI00029AF596|nr:hypothetical protein [Schlesneria paludicola]
MSTSTLRALHPRAKIWHAVLVGAASSVILLGLWDFWPKHNVNRAVDVTPFLGRKPKVLSLEPQLVPVLIPEKEIREVAQKVVSAASTQTQSTSALLHATRLSTMVGPGVREWMERDEAGRIIRLNVGAEVFKDSWRGFEVRQTSSGDRTEHRDQFLAAIAQMGVSLSCAIGPEREDGRAFAVSDLLQTSLAEFHLKQSELSWTATAYALYLPPQLYWSNRYQERFDFDDLTRALIDKPLKSESCSGIHLMLALTTIMHVDRQSAILRDDTRSILEKYLRMRVAEAVESQLPDGSWPAFWAKSGFENAGPRLATPAPTFLQRLTIGGHLLEWLQMLPRDQQPPESTIKSGLLWITPQILSMPERDLVPGICPCTHALLAVNGSLRLTSNR